MMVTFRAGKFATALVLSSLAVACSREQQDWRSAEGEDTMASYGQFLAKHSDSELAIAARTRLAQLAEDRDWQRAGAADTAEAYRQFLTQHPSGKWAQEARIRIESFALGALPLRAAPSVSDEQQAASAAPSNPNTSNPTSGEGGASTAPAPAPGSVSAAAATAAPPAVAMQQTASARGAAATDPSAGNLAATDSGGASDYGVQLGAFSSQSAAANEWTQLVARFDNDLRGLVPRVIAVDTASGSLYRLQALVGDEAHARSICDALHKQSQACVPVVPR